jgi:uncharacterized protein YndB with AHSA1/START domain
MKSSETLKVNLPSDLTIELIRVFGAPRRLVFEAWTNPKHLPKWLLGPEGWSMTICEIDLRPGGAWHYGWRHSDGKEMEMRGVYKEVKPPELLVSTESWGDPWPETINTLSLTEKDGKTTATTTILYTSKEARDAALKSGMKEGVAISFDRLSDYLRTIENSSTNGGRQ